MAVARGQQFFVSDGEETVSFNVFVDSVYDEDSERAEEDDNTDHEQAGEAAAHGVLGPGGGGEEAGGAVIFNVPGPGGGGGEARAGLPAVPGLGGGDGVQAQAVEQQDAQGLPREARVIVSLFVLPRLS